MIPIVSDNNALGHDELVITTSESRKFTITMWVMCNLGPTTKRKSTTVFERRT